jgi:transposase
MISPPSGLRIMVSSRPVDFHNGLDGLAAMVFRAKRADRVKVLYWDGTGLCLFHKRLEQGRFVWPAVSIRLGAGQLGLLLDGLEWSRARPSQ